MSSLLRSPGVRLRHAACALALPLLAPLASAQTSPSAASALAYLAAHQSTLGLSASDLASVTVVGETFRGNIRHVYLQQRVGSIPVHEGIMAVTLRGTDQVAALGDRFQRNLTANATTPGVSATSAIATAASSVGLSLLAPLAAAGTSPSGEELYTDGGISQQPIPVKLVLVPSTTGPARLAWDVEIYTKDSQHYWSIRVDAVSNTVLSTSDWVIKCQFGEDPTLHAAHEAQSARNRKGQITDAPLQAWERAGAVDFRSAASTVTGSRPAWTAVQQVADIRFDRQALATRAAAVAAAVAYRVYDAPIEAPFGGPANARTLVTTAGNPTYSPLGWHNDGATDYVITRGNNVYAYLDNGGGEAGLSPLGTTTNGTLTFDFPVDLTQQPGSYGNAAATNLFYWNNIIHDYFYPYGFDEVSGNIQQTNLTGQGMGGDALLAQAQDGGGTNNANQLTLQDGTPPRQQMYLWEPSDPATFRINTPAVVAGNYLAIPAGFGPAIGDPGYTNAIVYAEPANACGPQPAGPLPAGFVPTPLTNAVAVQGKIVLIDRGGCAFAEKAYNAQISGAVAVIVANNVAGADPFTMGSASPAPAGPNPLAEGVTIPAAMVSFETGNIIKGQLPSLSNPTAPGVNGTLIQVGGPSPLRDGDFDNGVITHEYGHSISTRLTGGPSRQCLSGDEQAGEGWSDWFGLLMTMTSANAPSTANVSVRSIGNYVTYQPANGRGIRPRPYTTNMSQNEYTYGMLGNPEITVPHGVGFAFASMLWEVLSNFHDRYGYDPDFINGTGGNNKLLEIVMEGLKIQPCSPGFINSRDAILQADRILNGGANQDIIWAGFAKRGLGFSARRGATLAENIEAFDLPPVQVAALSLTRTVTPGLIPDGTTATVTLRANNPTAAALTGLVLRDTLDARTIASGLPAGATVSGNVITFAPFDLAVGAAQSLSYKIFVATGSASTFLLRDDVEAASATWTASANGWVRSTAKAVSGTTSWFIANPDGPASGTLTLTNAVSPVAGTVMTFNNFYNTETNFDGGVVEISTDNGVTWQDLGPHMTRNGYATEPIPAANNPLLADRRAFHGTNGGFQQTKVDLSSFAGQSIKVRFNFAADALTGAEGWYVDDITIVTNPTSVRLSGVATSAAETARTAQDVFVVAGAPGRVFTALDAHVLLGGAMGPDGQMSNALNTTGSLPTTQPYGAFDGTPLDYDGTESVAADFFATRPHLVDWVLVELRGSATSAPYARTVGFLTRTGQIVALDGTSPLTFEDFSAAPAFVVVRHRNHVAVMSNVTGTVSGAVLRHDFRGSTAAYNSGGQRDLGSGRFGMHPGNANADDRPNTVDLARWKVSNGQLGYQIADFDLSGRINTFDRIRWRAANGAIGTVPQAQ